MNLLASGYIQCWSDLWNSPFVGSLWNEEGDDKADHEPEDTDAEWDVQFGEHFDLGWVWKELKLMYLELNFLSVEMVKNWVTKLVRTSLEKEDWRPSGSNHNKLFSPITVLLLYRREQRQCKWCCGAKFKNGKVRLCKSAFGGLHQVKKVSLSAADSVKKTARSQ